jgi:hypothetical protein
VFFAQFLKAGGLFSRLCAGAPFAFQNNNAPQIVDVLGTLVLSILAGHSRYAHISALRFDQISAPILGMSKVIQEDCRRRRTPESVRFLGRRVYAGLVVVLITAMIHGLKPSRVRRIREALQIDSRTLKRWRQWWLDNFVRSSFWRAARARSCLWCASGRCLGRCG